MCSKKGSQMRTSAFVPAHISGFFQPCITNTSVRTGSRNCGPCLDLGVETDVKVERSSRASVKISINGRRVPDASTTAFVVDQIMDMARGPFNVEVNHLCQVPVGAGFGASGAGALGAALALSRSLKLRKSRESLVAVAHVADVKCYTGLGDVGAQAYGGLVIGLEPGAPPYGRWKRIAVPHDVKVVCATLGHIQTKDFLRNEDFRGRARELGGAAINQIMRQPNFKTAISVSRDFADKLGLFDDELRDIAKIAESAGAIGASQAMLGRSVFAFVTRKKLKSVRGAFLEVLEPSRVIEAGIYKKRVSIQT